MRANERDALTRGAAPNDYGVAGTSANWNDNRKTKEADEKRQRLLGKIEEVKIVMSDNLEKGLANIESTEEVHEKTTKLVRQAELFARNAGHSATRAYWDNVAPKVYIGGAGIFVILLILMLIFHFVNICEAPEEPPEEPPAHLAVATRYNSTRTDFKNYGEEADHFWAWECPTMWMGMLMICDILFMGLFSLRKKIWYCWCHGFPMLGCW